jgi:hypothetical protein
MSAPYFHKGSKKILAYVIYLQCFECSVGIGALILVMCEIKRAQREKTWLTQGGDLVIRETFFAAKYYNA